MNRRTPVAGALACAIGLALFVACSSDDNKTSETKDVASRDTKPPPPPVAPLTGLPDPSGASTKRCAVTVKIDNTRRTQPKHGVEFADVVYEEVVEGGITRLAAVFNSRGPQRVASVRSVRKTDQSLVTPLRGVFVYSGGAPYAVESIETAPVVLIDETRAGNMMFRDERRAPYDLNVRLDQIYAKCKDPAPQPLFSYRAAEATVIGDPVATARVGFRNGFAVTWTWDATSGTWKRAIFDKAETTADGTQFAPKNVVVMFAQYTGGDSDGVGAEAQLTGTGRLIVLTDGKAINGTWSRPDKTKPAQLLDAAGSTIKLTPGQTWVELPEPDYDVTVTPPPTPQTTTT
jgi:hypothetical protein